MAFIKLHHEIFEQGLTPNAFRAYCAILRFMNTATGYANVCASKLGEAINLSQSSIQRGVRELQEKKLVRVIRKQGRNGYWLANGYQVTYLRGRFAKLPVEALSLPLKATGFMIYVYLLRCADKGKRAFPSLTGIAKGIGVSVPTVIGQIKELVSCNLLEKKHYIKKDRSFGHNQYRLQEAAKYQEVSKTAAGRKKERTHLLRMPLQSISFVTLLTILIIWCGHAVVNEYSVNIRGGGVALFYFSYTVLKICSNRNYTHLATRDKKEIGLYLEYTVRGKRGVSKGQPGRRGLLKQMG